MSLTARTLLFSVIELLVIGAVLFYTAGTLAWPAGWVFLALFTVYVVPVVLWLLREHPGVIEERISLKPGQKVWDQVFATLITAFFLGWLVLMPLDAVRFHWSHVPRWLQVVGALVLLVSFYLFFLVFRENPYLSSVVRIQEERGHRAITTGPYRYVRHPMYAAALLLFLGTALLLGSWYGALATLGLAGLLGTRAMLEERTLREELPGYEAYVARVRYRFIPRVW